MKKPMGVHGKIKRVTCVSSFQVYEIDCISFMSCYNFYNFGIIKMVMENS